MAASFNKLILNYFIKDQERIDPMAKVFPKVSKCTFHKYGPSGTIARHDGLCILPINIINEKEYYKQLLK